MHVAIVLNALVSNFVFFFEFCSSCDVMSLQVNCFDVTKYNVPGVECMYVVGNLITCWDSGQYVYAPNASFNQSGYSIAL